MEKPAANGLLLPVQYEVKEAGSVLLVRKPGQRHALHRWVIDRRFDSKIAANALLADLGALVWTALAPL